ncbi:MAG: hypothetical protein H0W76_05195 [Pyrinomonadaceae bacterium]|nr:hypothetical protein [Pyrinomonadaceae bacterium]
MVEVHHLYSHPKSHARRARQVLFFLAFEVYYGLCKLRGYKAHHFLDPAPEWMRSGLPERIMLVWSHLPLSIRLLDRIFPFGRTSHAELMPYTPEAAEDVRTSGKRAAVVNISRGELCFGGSFK